MEWNALLNAVVRDRNVMGVKDPLMDLLVAMCMELVRLEAATAYARPQWETLGPDATTPVETLRENQREALKEINARTQPLSLDHLDVSCAILADAILSLAAATAYASSASSPSTTGPSAKPLPSPGA